MPSSKLIRLYFGLYLKSFELLNHFWTWMHFHEGLVVSRRLNGVPKPSERSPSCQRLHKWIPWTVLSPSFGAWNLQWHTGERFHDKKNIWQPFFPFLPVSSYPVQPLQLRSLARCLVSLTCQQRSSVLVWLFYLVNWNNLPSDVLT